MQQQKNSIAKVSPSTSTQQHAGTSHHAHVEIHPSNDAQDTIMVLALSMRGKKCFHELYHSNSDKEVAKVAEPLGLELDQGNAIIVSSTSDCGNSSSSSSKWIDLQKKKEKMSLNKIHNHSWVSTRKVVYVLTLSILG